jgi:aspartyl-tRNA(Asn)/glutamyl-tRNA(Gln) amidotransferase subunit C
VSDASSQAGAAGADAGLSAEQVRRVARLARLRLTEAQVDEDRVRLSSVLGYMRRLQSVDLTGVEPMSHPGGSVNHFRPDEPQPPLPAGTIEAIAPAHAGGMVRIPKVIGDGGA